MLCEFLLALKYVIIGLRHDLYILIFACIFIVFPYTVFPSFNFSKGHIYLILYLKSSVLVSSNLYWLCDTTEHSDLSIRVIFLVILVYVLVSEVYAIIGVMHDLYILVFASFFMHWFLNIPTVLFHSLPQISCLS